jgi:hypothetical protein
MGDESPNITHTNDEESNGLEEEEYVVVVIPNIDIVASTEEEVSSDTKLQNMQPDSNLKFNLGNN